MADERSGRRGRGRGIGMRLVGTEAKAPGLGSWRVQ